MVVWQKIWTHRCVSSSEATLAISADLCLIISNAQGTTEVIPLPPDMSTMLPHHETPTHPSPSAPTPPPPPPQTSMSGRPARARRLPKALNDFVPSSMSALQRLTRQRQLPVEPNLETSSHTTEQPTSGSGLEEVLPNEVPTTTTLARPAEQQQAGPVYEEREVDGFGLYRSYLVPPTLGIDAIPVPAAQCDEATLRTAAPSQCDWWAGFGPGVLQAAADSVFYPSLNTTTFRLMHWFYTGSSMKSLSELDHLVSEVILAEDFNHEDLRGFSAAHKAKRVDDVPSTPSVGGHLPAGAGWHHANVSIHLPGEGVTHSSEAAAPVFDIPGLYYRKIMNVIMSVFEDVASASWNMVPHRLWWKSPLASPDDPPEQVRSEMYNSDTMVMEYEKLTACPRAPGDHLEIAIAGIMLWSDLTHLAQFGNTSLWPIYLFFANQSKYIRAQPTFFAAHHLAYIPSVSCPSSMFSDTPTHHSSFVAD